MATLNLSAVTQHGGFVGGLVKKELTWTNPAGVEVSFDVYIKPYTFADVIESFDPDSDRVENAAKNIASSVCNERGEPIFSISDITGEDPETGEKSEKGALSSSMALLLLAAIGEANAEKKTKPTRKKN